MIDDSTQKRSNNAVLAIAVGGLAAGILDLTQAMLLFGKNIPLPIAAGLLGAPGVSRRRGNLYFGCAAALLHCLLGSGHLFRSQPQADILNRASSCLRDVLWCGCPVGDEPRCAAAFRVARNGTIQLSRPGFKVSSAHGHYRAADFFQYLAVRPAVR
jgi:hypothetical protein